MLADAKLANAARLLEDRAFDTGGMQAQLGR
jgi:hypothetical protein